MFTFYMDDKFIEITDFSENLSGDGNLTFIVSNNSLKLDNSSFNGLNDLKEIISNGEVLLKIEDSEGHIIWESNNYILQNANFNANENGMYFSAYFNQFTSNPAEDTMEPTSREVVTE